MKSIKKNPLYSIVERILDETKSKQEHIEKFLYTQRKANIGNFASEIAHNLNNILGGILGYSQLLQNELKPSSNAYRQAKLIEQATKRASKLIFQLLIFSENQRFQKKPVDPQKLVEDVVTILESGFSKNITINTHFNHKSKKIWADFFMMTQVLLNICLNARDAMPTGGKLTIQTKHSNNFVVFKITDTGRGIKKEISSSIFEPFFTTKEPGLGSGLGLTIVEGIVKDHGGKIKVFSKVGKGTTFEIYIPVTKEPFIEPEKTTKFRDITGKGALIMVVDDEEDLREMAKTIFEKKGYKVLLAKDGKSAIKTYNKHADEIQLVILDMILPGIDGAEVYRKIKSKGSGTKIILTSGYSKNSSIQNIINQGVELFLPKPWNLPELIKETKQIIKSS